MPDLPPTPPPAAMLDRIDQRLWHALGVRVGIEEAGFCFDLPAVGGRRSARLLVDGPEPEASAVVAARIDNLPPAARDLVRKFCRQDGRRFGRDT